MTKRKRQELILSRAIEAFVRETALPAETIGKLSVEIKGNLNATNIGAVISHMKQIPQPERALLVTEYVNSSLAARLRQAGVQFLDTAGNASIQQFSVFVYISGRKQDAIVKAAERNLAFQPAGLKVILALLQNPQLVNTPYRNIAKQANVSLGAVGAILRDLAKFGYVAQNTHGQRTLPHQHELINQWVEHYSRLRARYELGTYTTETAGWWKNQGLNEQPFVWGGEIAAATYTRYLNARDAIVYLDSKDLAAFLATARLRKIKQGEIPGATATLYEPFWTDPEKSGLHIQQPRLAPPLIVYADLVATGDPRNLEAAQRLREKYID